MTGHQKWYRDWPPTWKLIGYPHSVGIDEDLEKDLGTISDGPFIVNHGGLREELVDRLSIDEFLTDIVGPNIVIHDSNNLWKLNISNVGGYAILGIDEILCDRVGRGRTIQAYKAFVEYVERGGVGFGNEGKIYAHDFLIPHLWSGTD